MRIVKLFLIFGFFMSQISLAKEVYANTEKSSVPEVTGFKIVKIQKGSVFQKLGLKVGDVIQSINGEEINTVDAENFLFAKTKLEKEIDLVILRQGKEEKLHYSIK